MATIQENVDLLFNKIFARKGSVITNSASTESNAYYSEYYASKQAISAEQIWTQSRLIPQDVNPLSRAPRVGNTPRNTPAYIDRVDASVPNSPVLLVNDKPVVQRLDLMLRPVPGASYGWAFGAQGSLSDQTPNGSTQPGAEWVSTFGPVSEFTGYNIIPFSYDPSSTLYRYELYSSKSAAADPVWGTSYTLTNPISFFDASGWFFDQDALLLNFMNRSLPSSVIPGAPLYIRVYRYVGKVGDFAQATDGGGSLQVSALGYIESAASAADIDNYNTDPLLFANPGVNNEKTTVYAFVSDAFAHPDAPLVGASRNFNAGQVIRYRQTTSKWEVAPLLDGARFLVRTEPLLKVPTFSFGPPAVAVASATVPKNSVVEYWKASTRGSGTDGFVVLAPSQGWRISITSDANKIWQFDGNNWIELIVTSAMGALTNKDMLAKITGIDTVTTAPTTTYNLQATDIGLLEVPSGDNTSPGYIEVQINGVAIKLGSGYDGTFLPSACFAKILPAFTVATASGVSTLSFGTTPHDMTSLNQIAFISAAGTVVTAVTRVDNFRVTVPVAFTPTAGTVVFFLKRFTDVKVQDTLVWFGKNAKFELDATDRISYIYVASAS